ncbi:MAG TPA: hypothetical protein VGP46_12905 [Acidimicrobiales bacterium]|nr:hypothetical protein [Acidimicrobiales bacterium]
MKALAVGDVTGGGSPSAPRAVFLTDFLHIPRPFERLAPILLDDDALWLTALSLRTGVTPEAASVSTQGQAPSALIRLRSLDRGARFPVHEGILTAQPGRRHEGAAIVPVTLEPASFEKLLPKLEADLELAAFGEDVCRLGITGRYRAPLGALGARLDKLGMHRLAESAIRSLLLDVEGTLGDLEPT